MGNVFPRNRPGEFVFTAIPSAQALEVSLCDQAFHVTLADVELAVFREGDGSALLRQCFACEY